MLILISGSSGSGKSHMAKELETYGLSRLSTYTTRAMRPGEVEGDDYHFMDIYEFESMVLSYALAEFAVFKSHYYGVSKRSLSLAGDYTLVVEPNGAASIHSFCEKEAIDHRLVFIDTPICVRHMLMRESRGEVAADERIFDDIKERYLALGIRPDIVTSAPGDHQAVIDAL